MIIRNIFEWYEIGCSPDLYLLFSPFVINIQESFQFWLLNFYLDALMELFAQLNFNIDHKFYTYFTMEAQYV